MLEEIEEKQIYPIGRIVVFKDSVFAEKRPDLSFMDGGEVWKNGRGESFVNPFMKEVWDHNVEIAIEAAKMGFQEIQFDYVRFPEGFEKRHESLKYDLRIMRNLNSIRYNDVLKPSQILLPMHVNNLSHMVLKFLSIFLAMQQHYLKHLESDKTSRKFLKM